MWLLADFRHCFWLISADSVSIFLRTTPSLQTFFVLSVLLALVAVNLVIHYYPNKEKLHEKSVAFAIIS